MQLSLSSLVMVMTPPSDSSVPGSPGPMLSGVPRAEFYARPNSHPFQNRILMFTGADQQIKVGRSVARSKPSPNNGIFDCKGKLFVRMSSTLANLGDTVFRMALRWLSFKPYYTHGNLEDYALYVLIFEVIKFFICLCHLARKLLRINFKNGLFQITQFFHSLFFNRYNLKLSVLSRNHALIWYENGKFFLQDTKSSNGTFVNNQRLSKGSEESMPREVCSGDILQVHKSVITSNLSRSIVKKQPEMVT